MQRLLFLLFAASLALFGSVVMAKTLAGTPGSPATLSAPPQTIAADPQRSAGYFLQIATVLKFPRCLNCHTATDFPRQDDDRHRHIMLVARGVDNRGSPALRCNTCHGNTNSPAGVPGNPNWHLAPLTMEWETLSDGEICRSLTDPKRGNMTLAQLVHHLGEDPLVGWAWDPGMDLNGKPRRKPPLSREELMRVVHQWIDTGAACPA
jgi:hypothetical protein